MKRFNAWSIHSHIIVLILLMALPAIGLIVYSGLQQRKADLQAAFDESDKLSDSIANEFRLQVDASRQLLEALALLPAVRQRNSASVNLLLSDFVRKHPIYTNIHMADHNGMIWASALPSKGLFVADRKPFRDAMATGRFSAGEYSVGRMSGKPNLNFGLPLKNEQGLITGVILFGFNLENTGSLLMINNFPEGTSFVIFDHKGTFLYRAFEYQKYVGKQDRPDLFARMLNGPDHGQLDIIGNDGVHRLATYRKLRLQDDQPPYAFIRASVPYNKAIEASNAALFKYLVMLSLLLILISGLALAISRRFIADRIVALQDASRRLASGDLNYRVADRVAGGELGKLGQVFDEMADALLLDRVTQMEKEEELRHVKEYTENLIQAANIIIVGMDTADGVTLMNRTAEEICGYTLNELRGKNWYAAMGYKETDREGHVLHEGRNANGLLDTFEGMITTRPGSTRIISWRNSAIIENEMVVGSISFGIDITEQRKLEEQLRQSIKLESIGRLAGGVAHDFNNKLTVILCYAEMSKLKLHEEDKLWQNLNEISKAATLSSDIARQLLIFSRQQIISPVSVDLNAAINDTLRTLGCLTGEEITLTFSPCDTLWEVSIDRSQFDQIMMNLTINARDAMPDGGVLAITTANACVDEIFCRDYPGMAPGEYVLLTFSDTGCGMDRETLQHIFEPFFTTKEVGKGTGLGLSTVYGIVSQNNGFIDVCSEPGQGAQFKIFLPRLTEEITVESQPACEPAATGSGTVLLVEDDELLCRMTTRMLVEIGYVVHPFDTPQGAVSFFEDKGEEIDLILSDVIMPGMNGREMMAKIETMRPDCKVLYMSGYAPDIIAQKGILQEHMQFIRKPFNIQQLNSKLREVLAGQLST